jgi:hypothetical protein
MMAVSLCLGLGLSACGDPDDNNDNNTNNGQECTEDADCTGDQVCNDSGMCEDPADECTEDADCDDGQVCNDNMCVDDGPECNDDEDCSGDQVCNDDNMCEDPNGGCSDDSQCGAGEFCTENGKCDDGVCANVDLGASCDPNEGPAGKGFACVAFAEGEAACAETCTPPQQGQPDPCQANSQCLSLQSGGGACVVTQCSLGGDECGAGANCQPISSDTNLCVPSGSNAEGENCLDGFDGTSTNCQDGLFCDAFFTGVCRTPCGDDSQCSGLNSCIGDEGSEIFSQNEGFCAEECMPFDDRGACGDGFGCQAITSDIGYCDAAGDIELYESCQTTACEQDSDCPTDVTCSVPQGQTLGSCNYGDQCAGDGRCITLRSGANAGDDGDARCLPACDPTSENPDQTCPNADPKSFIRFQHISVAADGAGISSVDIYVDDSSFATDVAYPSGPISTLPFSAVDPGTRNIKIYTAGADTSTDDPILEADVDLEANAQVTYVVVDGPDGSGGVEPTIQSFMTPRGVQPDPAGIKLRVFHGIPGLPANVDIFVVPAGSDIADRGTDGIADPIVSDLGYGNVNVFPDGSGGTMPFATLPGGGSTYDAYITTTGGDPESGPVTGGGDVLGTVTGLGAPDGSILTLAAIADTNGPTSIPLPYSQEEETRVFGGFCLDLSAPDQDATPQSGVCLEQCNGVADYGEGLCSSSAEGDHCTPFRDRSVCWPSPNNAIGDSCDPTGINSCDAGSYCRGDGAGNGVCKAHCSLDPNVTNPLLGCTESGESCAPIAYAPWDVGECRQECDLADNPDSACPANLQQCLPYITDDNFDPATNYCSQSGSVAVGDSCEGAAQNNCVAEAICAQGPADDDPVCRTACDLLASDSGCADGEVCYPSLGSGSSSVGYCVDEDPDLAGTPTLGQCPVDKSGNPCGNGSICIQVQANPAASACLQFCDLGSNTGCMGEETCEPAGPLFGIASYEGNPPLPYTLGVCLPPA